MTRLSTPRSATTANRGDPVCTIRHRARPTHSRASVPFQAVTPHQNRRAVLAGPLDGCQAMTRRVA